MPTPFRDHTFARSAGFAAAMAVPLMALSTPLAAQENAGLPPADLVAALKQGGHVVFVRHGSTESDYADQINAVMGDCSTQRGLSEAGWHEARDIGAAFERLEIPVGAVVSSEYCRGWQTADLAFGTYEKTADLNFEPAEEYTEAQIETMRTNVTPHLGKVLEEGNTTLVGHDDPFEAATGIYPEPMGVVFVIRPGGDGSFEVLGSIAPEDWAGIGG